MKKIIRSLMCVLLAAVIVCSFAGCANSEIKGVISDFESACNDLDFNAMSDCINPRITGVLDFASGLIGMFTEKDTEEMLDKLSELIVKGEDGADREEFFSSIKIKVDEITVEDEQAVVTAIVNYEKSGKETVREAVFTCEYYADEWYINTFVLN